MSIKKFLIIAIILSLFTVGAVSAASIIDQTTDLLEKNGYTITTHIDDKYDEMGKYSQYVYNKEKTQGTTVLVVYSYDYTVSLDDLKGNFTEKTINNTKGFYKQSRDNYLFHYQCGNDSIGIKTDDPNIISKIVLGNDPIA